jgi:hypothetical protein
LVLITITIYTHTCITLMVIKKLYENKNEDRIKNAMIKNFNIGKTEHQGASAGRLRERGRYENMENEKVVAGATTGDLPGSAGAGAAQGAGPERKRILATLRGDWSDEERLALVRAGRSTSRTISLDIDSPAIEGIDAAGHGIVGRTASDMTYTRVIETAIIAGADVDGAVCAKAVGIEREAAEKAAAEAEREAAEKAMREAAESAVAGQSDLSIAAVFCDGVRFRLAGLNEYTVDNVLPVKFADEFARLRLLLARDQQRKAAETAAAEKAAAEKAAWIQAHGSERLKAIIAAGYSGAKLYAQERDADAFAGLTYAVDATDAADAIRDSPSPEALEVEAALKASGHDAKIVWLKEDPQAHDEDSYDEFAPREAVRVYTSWRKGAVYIYP